MKKKLYIQPSVETTILRTNVIMLNPVSSGGNSSEHGGNIDGD